MPTDAPPAPTEASEGVAELVPDAPSIDDEERAQLLDVARAALQVATGLAPSARLRIAIARARRTDHRAAAFVTVFEGGSLRGCMGAIDPSRPVADSIAQAALCAARDDPRFRSIQPDELPLIELEVSVLGPRVPLQDPRAFRLGVDGIVVQGWGRRALLLPQVATEYGLSREGMLETICEKAWLPSDAWSYPEMTTFAFRTVRFGGPALARAEPRG